MFIVVLALLFVFFPQTRFESDRESCSVFLLKAVGADAFVEKVTLLDGEAVELDMSPTSAYVTVLLPFGVGQSGEVVQVARRARTAIVQCDGGYLRTVYYRPDGSEHAMPAVSLEDMRKYDMRVNVTTVDGPQVAYLISTGSAVKRAGGPVIDMFRGLVPLEQGDYSITTETTVHKDPPSVTGSAPVIFDGDHLFVEGTLPGGRTGMFIVDFGAGSTVLDRSVLPIDAEIDVLVGIEYTEQGSRTVDGVAAGLGGAVESFLGRTTLAELTFGTASFRDARVSVVANMPDIGGMRPIGILGLDLLSRARVASVSYQTESASDGGREIRWLSDREPATTGAIEVPFSVASNHLFTDGSVGSTDVDFVLDTGARVSIMSRELAISAGLRVVADSASQLRGLDGTAVDVDLREAEEIVLGGQRLRGVPFHTGNIDALERWGLRTSGAIIGNDFLQRFQRLEVDFGRNVILLVE